MLDRWPETLAGAALDVGAAIIGFLGACLLGIVLSTILESRRSALRAAAFVYVQFARGVPPYILLLWLYFGVSQAFRLAINPVEAIVATIALTGSGYTTEVFRAARTAVGVEQATTAHALGFGSFVTFADVLFPQLLRVALRPLGSIFIGHLKLATLMSIIAARDMVYVAREITYRFFRPFEAYTEVALILVALVFAFSGAIRYAERKLELP